MKREPLPPDCWHYPLPDGFTALAGKTDADNDQLSLKTARPNDHWFHLSGQPGSHVILQHPDNAPPSRDILRAAAAIAAWHSKARPASKTTIHYTQAKHVTKPRGAKPGTVQIQHAKTLKVAPALPTQQPDP